MIMKAGLPTPAPITRSKLPAGYVPYESLTVCSNQILGGGLFMEIGEAVPLLVGSGEEQPQVWLLAPADKSGRFFVQVVAASISLHKAISVSGDPQGLTIMTSGVTILRVKQLDRGSAVISELDLRPLGFQVFGDARSLKVAGMEMRESSFSGVGVAFKLG